MQIFSIYESMEESGRLCPNGQNIKLLIRHSIRQDIKDGAGMDEIENAQLTREGKKMAGRFGEVLDLNIGTVSSSCSSRCIDTCLEIIRGYNKTHIEYTSALFKTAMLQAPHCKNVPEQHTTWKKFGIEGIFDCFARNIDMPGLYNLETSSKRIIDYLFETGNKSNTIDIFCTHDFQLAMLLLFFNKKKQEYKQALFSEKDSWPFMLEGMFLWGNKKSLCIAWRGETKNISIT